MASFIVPALAGLVATACSTAASAERTQQLMPEEQVGPQVGLGQHGEVRHDGSANQLVSSQLYVQRVLPFASAANAPLLMEVWAAPPGYLGCFSGVQVLPVRPPAVLDLTPARCRAACAAAGHNMFGLQGGSTCSCATGPFPGPNSSRTPEANCWNVCAGSELSRCGGPSATAVFSVAGAVPSVASISLDWSLYDTATASSVPLYSGLLGEAKLDMSIVGQSARLRHNVTLPRTVAAAIKPWDLDTPALYTLCAGVSLPGQVNTSCARFGFRSVRRTEGQVWLNGRRVFLRGVAMNPPGRGLEPSVSGNSSFARTYLRTMRQKYGVNIVRIEPGDDEIWWDAADEIGILVFEGRYGAPRGSVNHTPPRDLSASLEAYKSEYFETQARHPSVIIRILSNEMPEAVFNNFLVKQCSALAAWDPTRLCLGNAGFGGGRSGDLADAHPYSGWYGGTFTGVAFAAAVQQDPSLDLPYTASECVGAYTGPAGTFDLNGKQLCAALMHGGTHADTSHRAVSDLEYQRFLTKRVTEPMRWLRTVNRRLAGLALFSPLFFNWNGVKSFDDMRPKPALQQLVDSYSPILLAIELWQPQVFPGSILNVTLHIVNDDDAGRSLEACDVTLHLATADSSRLISELGYLHTDPTEYFGVTTVTVQLTVANTVLYGDYSLTATLQCGSAQVAQNHEPVFVAPLEWAQDIAEDKSRHRNDRSLYVIDPSGTTSSALVKLGIPFVKANVSDPGAIPAGPNAASDAAVLVGEGVWSSLLDAWGSILQRFVAEGGRVLLLAQGAPAELSPHSLDWLPVPVTIAQLQPNQRQMTVNAVRAAHPVWSGDLAARLGTWSPALTPASFVDTKLIPDIFPVTNSIGFDAADLSHVAVHADYQRGLASVAMLEVFADLSTNGSNWCEDGVRSGAVCCAASCGRCGGQSCQNRPGGPSKCCAGSMKRICADFADTVCRIPAAQTREELDQSASAAALGSVLISGLGVVARASTDPVAARLLVNMARYTASRDPHHPSPMVTGSDPSDSASPVTVAWGDYFSENGTVSGARNGMVVHTERADVVAPGATESQIVPRGRQLLKFAYSGTCHLEDLEPTTTTAVGTVFLRVGGTRRIAKITTVVENPTRASANISVSASPGPFSGTAATGHTCTAVVPASASVAVECSLVLLADRSAKLVFEGDKGLVLANTTFE